MKITIDTLQGQGAGDYTAWVDASVAARIERKINAPAEFGFALVGGNGFVAPAAGARVVLARADGSVMFTGYLTQAPELEYLGWGERGAAYRYRVTAMSDEMLLDQKTVPNRAPFVERTAGSALRQLAQDLLPGRFDLSAVEDVDTLAAYEASPAKKFSAHAAEIALAARASYRALNGQLLLAPVGASSYAIEESDANFSPGGLALVCANSPINDVTVIGKDEPEAYVRDYFVGDGLSLKFYLSQKPFAQSRPALIDEAYLGPGLDAATWAVNDPTSAVSVVAQTLQVGGGTGVDGQTTVCFVEQVELGGALKMQHGDVSFSGPSQGIVGGLYAGAISAAGCLAGFQATAAGAGSSIQGIIDGEATGPVVATTAGHRYAMTTYVYSMEVYRAQERFHSSAHPAGNGWGGGTIAADVRCVLELQDIDPNNPASMVAPATVLYDGVIASAPGFCRYALVNAGNMHCSIAYSYVTHIALPEVRVALPDANNNMTQNYVTQLIGSIADGGQCQIVGTTSLDFNTHSVPPLNTLIVVSYRGSGRAVAEVVNAASVAALQSAGDDGMRGMVRTAKAPSARTQADCENAALAILDDEGATSWSGAYETWSDFLPAGATDLFPGDGVTVHAPSRNAVFSAIVRRVAIDLADPDNDRGLYRIEFANDAAAPLALQAAASSAPIFLQSAPLRLTTTQVGTLYLQSLSEAQVSQVSSTTVTVDAGVAPANGQGIEVRAHDFGWGVANDRNLLGRFTTQTFTVPRLGRTQNYFLRLYDNSAPPRYSRYSAALHVDYPL